MNSANYCLFGTLELDDLHHTKARVAMNEFRIHLTKRFKIFLKTRPRDLLKWERFVITLGCVLAGLLIVGAICIAMLTK